MIYPKRRRLNIDLSEDQYQIIDQVLPHGSRQSFFEPLIEDICRLLRERPREIISAVISRRVKASDINSSLQAGEVEYCPKCGREHAKELLSSTCVRCSCGHKLGLCDD